MPSVDVPGRRSVHTTARGQTRRPVGGQFTNTVGGRSTSTVGGRSTWSICTRGHHDMNVRQPGEQLEQVVIDCRPVQLIM